MTPNPTRPAAEPAGAATLRHPRHAGGAGLALAVVLMAHALLLAGLPGRPPPAPQAADGGATRPPPMRVRQIAAGPGAEPVLPATSAAAPAGRPAARPAQATAAPDAPASNLAAAAPAASEAAAPPPGEPLPVYATRPPPPATLQYALRRGGFAGAAELLWRPSADGYQLTLRHQGANGASLGWTSQGGFDGAGVAPGRYTESRRGRELRAASFQREAGLITFSGPAVQHPLWNGAQDRLSWMIQLGAVLEAEPARAQPGQQVSMWVVGSRGDAEPWVFTVLGAEDLELPAGAVAGAVRLRRPARWLYDTQAEVWLDPARHHLPVRVRLLVPGGGDLLELQLQDHSRP